MKSFPLFLNLLMLLVMAPPLLLAGEAEKGPAPFESLKFRSIGPAFGGRVSRVAGVPGDPHVYYAATASGGVWKSSDGGLRWEPIFDDQPVSSMGSIAVSSSDPNVIYVGSGEANIRGNVAAGNGIYKSMDGGKTWAHVWDQEGQIGTLIVHPRNPDIAFAAVLGHAFGPNPERGVYRTQDGGKNWERVLWKDENRGASDVAFDPSNPHLLFAGLWQARRHPWELTSGGEGSGLYRSRDGGDTWKQLQGKGLPKGVWGKVGVAVAPSDGRRVYALIEAEEGGLFRSDDGGKSWRRASGHRALRQRAWYYSTLTIDPRNPDVIWVPQVPMLKSIDGGETFKYVKGIHHGDHHDLWIDPRDPQRMIAANDGGVDVTVNGGETWFAPPLPISQFYHINVDQQVPYRVSGALQDLGTASGPSNSLSSAGIRLSDWHSVGGGEAGHTASDPSDPNVVYAGEYGGYISRYDHRTRLAENVSIYPENPSGHGAKEMRYRFQWTAPIAISPHDPKVVYHGANVLFRTSDGGQSWTPISPDLTRDDKSKQGWSGGPITGDNTGVETYCTLFAIAESPRQEGVIWVGSDDGLVHVTRDGGTHWTSVTENIPAMPEWGTVSMIETSPFDAATAYLVVDAHRLDDMRPYLWKTEDFGRSWRSLSQGLPADVYLHALREDPKKRGLLYVGSERGVVFSRNDGASWEALHLGLPTVAVHDLRVKDDDLVVGTHGRSAWILDDLTPLREMSPEVAESDAFLFPVQPAIRWRYHFEREDKGTFPNPPQGAIVNYFLKRDVEEEITLEILDSSGRVIRILSTTAEEPDTPPGDPDGWGEEPPKPALSGKAGVQRAVWDLRYAGALKIKGAKLDFGDPRVGPLVLPGAYTARLHVEGKSYTTPITVRPDPRNPTSSQDAAKQLDLALRVRDSISELSEKVEQLRALRRQIEARQQLWRNLPQAAATVQAATGVIEKLNALERKLHNPDAEVAYDILAQKGGAKLYSRLAPLLEWLMEGEGAPTQGVREVYAQQKRELAGYVAEFRHLISEDLGALNSKAKGLNLPDIVVPEPFRRPE
ncbi:MAG: WD40/YVTN/BNR-like repeat-containing protein [Acidobacteriota bacterium]